MTRNAAATVKVYQVRDPHRRASRTLTFPTDYVYVANVVASSAEEAFEAMNNPSLPDWRDVPGAEKVAPTVYSMSAGDVVHTEDGFQLCLHSGWARLERRAFPVTVDLWADPQAQAAEKRQLPTPENLALVAAICELEAALAGDQRLKNLRRAASRILAALAEEE